MYISYDIYHIDIDIDSCTPTLKNLLNLWEGFAKSTSNDWIMYSAYMLNISGDLSQSMMINVMLIHKCH